MHLLALILGIVLLPKVTSLKCYQCMGENTCTSIQTACSDGQSKCAAMSVLTYAGGSKVSELQMKSCASPAECIQGSMNFGVGSTQMTSQCCDSDLCNRYHYAAPAPGYSAPNGLKCYTCNEKTCGATLACRGDEDRCMSTEVTVGNTKVEMKGCVSSSLCSQAADPQLKEILGEFFSCCEGSFCNSAGQRSGTSAGLLLLPTLLLSLLTSS